MIISRPPQIVAPGCISDNDCGVALIATTDETAPLQINEFFAECKLAPPPLLYDGTARGDGVFFSEGTL